MEREQVFEGIDSVIENINRFKVEPKFSKEIKKRNDRGVKTETSREELFSILVELIAFSNAAKSYRVKEIIEEDVLKEVLAGYEVEKVAKMNPCDLVDEHWEKIKGIRQKTKLFQIVSVARIFQKGNKFEEFLKQSGIPVRLKSVKDIAKFWDGFKALKKEMKKKSVPYLQSTTSLLHLLLEMGYDCAKPDSAVMKVSKRLGIINNAKTNDKDLQETVKTIQEYSIWRKYKPSVVDLYFLIEGGQSGVKELVEPRFYNA